MRSRPRGDEPLRTLLLSPPVNLLPPVSTTTPAHWTEHGRGQRPAQQHAHSVSCAVARRRMVLQEGRVVAGVDVRGRA